MRGSPCSSFRLGHVVPDALVVPPTATRWRRARETNERQIARTAGILNNLSNIVALSTWSYAPIPSTLRMVINAGLHTLLLGACVRRSLSQPFVDRAHWNGAHSFSNSAANCFARVLPRSLRNEHPVAIPRTPPSSFARAVKRANIRVALTSARLESASKNKSKMPASSINTRRCTRARGMIPSAHSSDFWAGTPTHLPEHWPLHLLRAPGLHLPQSVLIPKSQCSSHTLSGSGHCCTFKHAAAALRSRESSLCTGPCCVLRQCLLPATNWPTRLT